MHFGTRLAVLVVAIYISCISMATTLLRDNHMTNNNLGRPIKSLPDQCQTPETLKLLGSIQRQIDNLTLQINETTNLTSLFDLQSDLTALKESLADYEQKVALDLNETSQGSQHSSSSLQQNNSTSELNFDFFNTSCYDINVSRNNVPNFTFPEMSFFLETRLDNDTVDANREMSNNSNDSYSSPNISSSILQKIFSHQQVNRSQDAEKNIQTNHINTLFKDTKKFYDATKDTFRVHHTTLNDLADELLTLKTVNCMAAQEIGSMHDARKTLGEKINRVNGQLDSVSSRVQQLEDKFSAETSRHNSSESETRKLNQKSNLMDLPNELQESPWHPVEDGPVDNSNLEMTLGSHTRALQNIEQRLVALETMGMKAAQPEGGRITKVTCPNQRRHLVKDSCYYIPPIQTSETPLFTWWDSRFLCKEVLGPEADLAVIETEAEMRELAKMIKNHFNGIEEFWLGASDLAEEGYWEWVTGRPLNQYTYHNWEEDLSRSDTNNCLSMLRGNAWVDEPCFFEKYPICELKV